MELYQSPKNRTQHPASKTFGTAILLTDLLFGFVLWILSGRMSSQILMFFLAVVVLTLALSLWMITRGFFLDTSMLHAFVMISDLVHSSIFSVRDKPIFIREDSSNSDNLYYITMSLPERQVRFSQFPNNFGLDALRDIGHSRTAGLDTAAKRIEYFYSDQFRMDVNTLFSEANHEQSLDNGLAIHSIDEVVEIKPRYFGCEFKYKKTKDSFISSGILFKHVDGYDKIQNCLCRKMRQPGD